MTGNPFVASLAVEMASDQGLNFDPSALFFVRTDVQTDYVTSMPRGDDSALSPTMLSHDLAMIRPTLNRPVPESSWAVVIHPS